MAARALLDAGATSLVSFGLAGGLDPALRPGDLVIADRVLVGGDSFVAATAWPGCGGAAGSVLASDTVVAEAAEKRRLWQATGAVAVDMESGAVARAAEAAGVPFCVVRAICDPAWRSLPPAALVALDAAGGVGLWRVLGSVLRRPGQVGALLALGRDAAAARRSLGALPPTP